MKTGRTLAELAAELQRQQESKRDIIAPQGRVAAVVVDGDVKIDGVPNSEPMALTPYAHGQIGDHLQIPRAYYDRMRQKHPDLLAANVNTWLQDAANDERMLRTIDGKVRAFLSPKYRPLDNFDLAQVVLPALIELDADVQSCELTETRMYIKAIIPSLSDELPAGLSWGTGHHIFAANDRRRVVSAIVIQNSEIGAGTLRVEPSVFTAVCTNLAILKAAAMKKYHVGRANSADEDWSIYADDTRKKDDEVFFLKVRDVVKQAIDREKFAAAIEDIRRAGDRKIEVTDLGNVVEVVTKRLALPKTTGPDILSWLAKGGQMNQWGLSSAITRAAQDVTDYELATDMERAGGEVLTWTEGEFAEIQKAA